MSYFMGLLAAMRPLRYVHHHIQPRFRHKCCKNHTYYIIISCAHVHHNFCGPGNSNLNFDKIMFHAAERRHAGPFWARRRRLAKNEPACITAKRCGEEVKRLLQFRMSAHKFNIETGRYAINRENPHLLALFFIKHW